MPVSAPLCRGGIVCDLRFCGTPRGPPLGGTHETAPHNACYAECPVRGVRYDAPQSPPESPPVGRGLQGAPPWATPPIGARLRGYADGL